VEAICQAVQLLLGGGQFHVLDIAVVMPYATPAHLIHHMLQGFLQITGPPFIELSSVIFKVVRRRQWFFWPSNDHGMLSNQSN